MLVSAYCCFFLALVASWGAVTPANATTWYWDGGGSTDSWLTASNWDPDSVPGAVDNVIIQAIPSLHSPYVYFSPSSAITGEAQNVEIKNYSTLVHLKHTLEFNNLTVSGSLSSGYGSIYRMDPSSSVEAVLDVSTRIYVGASPGKGGKIQQYGGSIKADKIYLGWSGGQGEYIINEGVTRCGSLFVGNTGSGTFRQNGGTVEGQAGGPMSDLSISLASGASGYYYLDGGVLNASNIHIGYEDDGDGVLCVTNGSLNGPANQQINVSPAGLLHFKSTNSLSATNLTVDGNVLAGDVFPGTAWVYGLTLDVGATATINAGELKCSNLVLAEDAVVTINAGSLKCHRLYAGEDGGVSTAGTLNIADKDAYVRAYSVVQFGESGTLSAVPDSKITLLLRNRDINGAFAVESTNATAMAGLYNVTLHCKFSNNEDPVDLTIPLDDEHPRNIVTLTAMSDPAAWGGAPTEDKFVSANFVLGGLIVGRDDAVDGKGQVVLTVDDSSGKEVLVRELHVDAGAAFDLGTVLIDTIGYPQSKIWYLGGDPRGPAVHPC